MDISIRNVGKRFGAHEVLRDVIAQRGHGMPTYGRGR